MTHALRIMTILGVAGTAALVALRTLIELGFGPDGAVWIRGIPLEYVTLVWFACLFAILLDGSLQQKTGAAANVTCLWILGAAGLGGIAWIIRVLVAEQRVINLSWTYWLAWSCIAGVFVLAAGAESRGSGEILRQTVTDLIRIAKRPTTWALTLGILLVLTVGPREPTIPNGGAPFARWYQRQARAAVPARWKQAPVTLVEMVDYQCPACRYAAESYQDTIRQAQATHQEKFAFLTVDFPLESECNPSQKGSLHPAACEAAAVVRLARASGPVEERRLVEWLWNHQEDLTPETIFDRVADTFDLHARELYPELLVAIRDEAAVGTALQVRGTPTYFLNGRRLPHIPPLMMQQAIALEVQALDRP